MLGEYSDACRAESISLQGFAPGMLALARDVAWCDERLRGPISARTAQALDMAQYLSFEVDPLDFAIRIPFAEPEHVRKVADALHDQACAPCSVITSS